MKLETLEKANQLQREIKDQKKHIEGVMESAKCTNPKVTISTAEDTFRRMVFCGEKAKMIVGMALGDANEKLAALEKELELL